MLSLFLLAVGITAVSAQADFRTRLIGYDGCSSGQRNDIDNAFWDTRPIMDEIREHDIDFNGAAALEFLGPPSYNRPRQADIQGNDPHDLKTRLTGGNEAALTKERYSQKPRYYLRPGNTISY
jgi:hypothetical protein